MPAELRRVRVFDWGEWQDGFDEHWPGDQNEAIRKEFRAFKRHVLENFKSYDIRDVRCLRPRIA